MMKHFKFGDILIFLLILAAAIFSLKNAFSKKGDKVSIQANGVSYEYSLRKDGIYQIPGSLGSTTVEIKNERIRIIDSPCPNKTCIKQGWGTTLVCLPNNVIISTERAGGFDAIAE